MLAGYLLPVLVALTARAQVSSDCAFPDTKANHWVYEALSRSAVDWQHDGKPPTRNNVVDTILKDYDRLSHVHTKPEPLVTDLNYRINRLAKSPPPTSRELEDDIQAVAGVLTLIPGNEWTHKQIGDAKRLINAFSVDLAARSLDSAEMTTILVKVDKSLVLDAKTAKELSSVDALFPDTKRNHWAYECVAQLKKDGLIVGLNGMSVGVWLVFRFNFAIAAYEAYSKLKSTKDKFDAETDVLQNELSRLQVSDEVGWQNLKRRLMEAADEARALGKYDKDIQTLKRVISGFDREITSLGLDAPNMLHVLDSYSKPVFAFL